MKCWKRCEAITKGGYQCYQNAKEGNFCGNHNKRKDVRDERTTDRR